MSVITLSELDLFSKPPIQNSIEREVTTEYRPVSALTSSTNQIVFNVPNAKDEYVNLRDIKLRMQVRFDLIKETDVLAADWDKVSSDTFLLHSMLKNVVMEINGKQVTNSQMTYSYKAYLETLLSFTQDSKLHWLQAAGWFNQEMDDDISKEGIALLKPSTPVPKDGKGKVIELYGKLFLDMCGQPKLLLGGSDLKITLIPHPKPDYYIIKSSALALEVKIIDVVLEVRKSRVSPLIVEAHALALKTQPARYYGTRSDVKLSLIQSGSSSYLINNIVMGPLPRRAVVGLVDYSASEGSFSKSPFNFKHFDLSYLCFHANSETYPSRPFTPDFKKRSLYARIFVLF